jgi:hypothetical protein
MRTVLVILCIASGFAQEVPKGLLGRWRTVEIAQNGMGAMYEFRPGGIALVSPGAIAPGKFTLEKDDILLPPLSVGGPANRQHVDLSRPGKLILSKDKQVAMDLTRVGKEPPGKPSIIGEWTGVKSMQGQTLEMRIYFYPDQSLLFLLPFQTQQVKYAISNNKMTITFPDGKVAQGPFSVSGNTISIPSIRAGVTSKLTRY